MKRLFLACGLFGVLLLASGCAKEKPEVPSWFKGEGKKDDKAVGKNSPEQLKRDLDGKIRQLEKKMTALDEAIAKATASKKDYVVRLNNAGVHSEDDLKKPEFKDDEELQRLKNLVLKKRAEIDKLQQIHKQYRLTLLDGKDALESLDQQLKLKQAGIGEKDLEELTVKIRIIDERLNASTDVGNLPDMGKAGDLDKILKGDK